MGRGGLAAHPKKAGEQGAHIALIDEGGSFLNPTVRRTRAPRGETPVLTGFGRHRDKVSTIAAISVAPVRRRLGLSSRTDPEHYIDAEAVASFLRDLLDRLRGRVIVVWDGGSNHKGPAIRRLLSRLPRLGLERLPGYAPELNPVECVGSHLKRGRLANFVPWHVRHLDGVVAKDLEALRGRPGLLRSLWKGSESPFPSCHHCRLLGGLKPSPLGDGFSVLRR